MSRKNIVCQPFRRHSAAFTIVELLVVIAIIGVLVSILLPAVSSVRDSAARTQNSNNLRQIGTAVQAYEESKKTYPPLVRLPGGMKQTEENMKFAVSWAFEILPFIEQQNVYDAWDPTVPVDDLNNSIAMASPIPTYANPRRRDARAIGPFVQNANGPRGSTLDYAANGGVVMDNSGGPGVMADVARLRNNPSSAKSDNVYGRRFDPKFSGPFHRQLAVRSALVKDGLSNTLCVGDRWIGPPVPTSGEVWNDLTGMAGASFATTIRFANPDTDSTVGLAFPSNKTDTSIYKFGSVKGDDCCFSFLDGRVLWIPYDIDPDVFMRLASINDGLPVPPLD